MEAVGTLLPQLDDIRVDQIAAPSRRAGWPRLVGEHLNQVGHPLFERLPTDDYLALLACDGASTSPEGPRPPVGIRLIVIHLLDRSSHPDLSVHREQPMKKRRGEGICPQFPALGTLPVGVEDETPFVDPSE